MLTVSLESIFTVPVIMERIKMGNKKNQRRKKITKAERAERGKKGGEKSQRNFGLDSGLNLKKMHSLYA